MGIHGLWNVGNYHSFCNSCVLQFCAQTVSKYSSSRQLTELVVQDGFNRHNLRKYRVGIDAKQAAFNFLARSPYS